MVAQLQEPGVTVGGPGPPGPPGTPGADGVDGVDGVDGTDGAQGLPGSDANVDDAVILAPGDSARNVVEPTGDFAALTLMPSDGQSQPVYLITNSNSDDFFAVYPTGRVDIKILEGENEPFLVRDVLLGDLFRINLDSDGLGTDAFLQRGVGAVVFTIRDEPDVISDVSLDFRTNGDVGGETRFRFVSVRDFITPENSATTLEMIAQPGQVNPLVVLSDENSVLFFRVMPNGATVIEATADVTELTLKAAVDQEEPILRVADGTDVDLVNVYATGRVETNAVAGEQDPFTVSADGQELFELDVSADLFTAAMVLARGDARLEVEVVNDGLVGSGVTLHLRPSGLDPFAFTAFVDFVTPANSVTSVVLGAMPDQTLPIVRLNGPDGFRAVAILPNGAIGTAGSEPDDADILDGECFRWFDPTAGAPTIKFKAKDANGDVFTATIPMTPA